MKRERIQPSYRQRMARVVAVIAADPMLPYSLEELAAIAHFSPFHFHRLYRSLIGETVMQTVRRLRLARAAVQLGEKHHSVTAIGQAAGYDSPQAFARAFKEYAGMAPRDFQNKLHRLAVPAALPHDAGTLAPALSQSAVQLVQQPPLRAVALAHQGPVATIPHTHRRLRQLLQAQLQHCHGWLGICRGDPEIAGDFSYLAAAVLDENAAAAVDVNAGGLMLLDIAGGCYARYELIGPYTQINATINALYTLWLPDSGYEPDDRPLLEWYRNDPHSTPAEALHTDLLIPVRSLSI